MLKINKNFVPVEEDNTEDNAVHKEWIEWTSTDLFINDNHIDIGDLIDDINNLIIDNLGTDKVISIPSFYSDNLYDYDTMHPNSNNDLIWAHAK